MATHDYNLANQSGASFRSDLNDALQAVLTNNSSASAPSTTAAYMFWADTNTGILKIRNSANDAWVELLQLDGTLTIEDGSASAVGLGFRDELNTGIFSSGASNFDVSIAGTTRLNISATGLNVTGTVTDDGATHDGDVTFTGASANVVFDKSDNALEFADNAKATFGASADLSISHESDNTFITNSTGFLHLRSDNGINLQDAGGNENFLKCVDNGAVELYYDGTKVFETKSGGLIFGDGGGFDMNINGTRHQFSIGGSEKMRLDSSGNLGIGTTSPSQKLHVSAGTDNIAAIFESTDAETQIRLKDNATSEGIISVTAGSFAVENTTTGSLVKITDNGNVGINTTSPSARCEIIEGSTGRSWTPASHTELLVERNGNCAISVIGEATSNCQINFGDENDENPGIIDYDHAQNDFTFFLNGAGRFEMDIGAFHPTSDDVQDIGRSGNRFDDIRATNGSIVTSDRNEKNTIVASDLGLDFVNKLTPVSYKFNNKTRTHYGLIAQDIETLLSTIGKSATDFAGFCKDEITFKTEFDSEGSPEEVALETPFDRYSLRYTEFIAPIIKAIQELSAKVTALEGS